MSNLGFRLLLSEAEISFVLDFLLHFLFVCMYKYEVEGTVGTVK
jgi:hypothetical protein